MTAGWAFRKDNIVVARPGNIIKTEIWKLPFVPIFTLRITGYLSRIPVANFLTLVARSNAPVLSPVNIIILDHSGVATPQRRFGQWEFYW